MGLNELEGRGCRFFLSTFPRPGQSVDPLFFLFFLLLLLLHRLAPSLVPLAAYTSGVVAENCFAVGLTSGADCPSTVPPMTNNVLGHGESMEKRQRDAKANVKTKQG